MPSENPALAIARDLAECGPVHTAAEFVDGRVECALCFAQAPDGKPVTHEPACPWQRAVEWASVYDGVVA